MWASTDARETGIYVIPLLQKILTKYKAEFPKLGEGWIFRGEKLLRPLDLDNLSRRDIPRYINGTCSVGTHFAVGLEHA